LCLAGWGVRWWIIGVSAPRVDAGAQVFYYSWVCVAIPESFAQLFDR